MKIFLRFALVALVGSWLASCAAPLGGMQKPCVNSDGQQLIDLRAQQIELEQRMEQVQATAGAPEASCDNICGWAENICRLSQRICGIAGRHPGEPDFEQACADARQRCAKAREKASGACACP